MLLFIWTYFIHSDVCSRELALSSLSCLRVMTTVNLLNHSWLCSLVAPHGPFHFCTCLSKFTWHPTQLSSLHSILYPSDFFFLKKGKYSGGHVQSCGFYANETHYFVVLGLSLCSAVLSLVVMCILTYILISFIFYF